MASIVVVGGGLAGLVCGWRLRRGGHDVEVLESEPDPGGRMQSELHGDFILERGAQLIASGYRNLLAVAQALDLTNAIRPVENTSRAVLRDGRLEPVDLDSPLSLFASRSISLRSRASLAGIGLDLFRWRSDLDPLRPEAAARLDGEDMGAYLERRVGRAALDEFIGPALAASFDCEIEDLSGAFLLLALRLALDGSRLEFIAGGLGRLTRALAERVPFRAGCRVFSVETETHGALVRYRVGARERKVVADAVVVAVPGCDVPLLCPKLTPTERGFFEAVDYTRGMVAHLLLERAPSLAYYAVAFPRREGVDLYGFALDHHKPGAAPAGAGLLHAALRKDACARMWDAPDEAVGKLVLENLARTPIGGLQAAQVVVHRWPRMLPRFRPGYLPKLASFLMRTERSPRIAFAGDYLIGPTLEGALTSGMRAASEVLRSLDVAS